MRDGRERDFEMGPQGGGEKIPTTQGGFGSPSAGHHPDEASDPEKSLMISSGEGFRWWDAYWGELVRDEDPRFPSILYGYETVSQQNRNRRERAEIQAVGACFGFVVSGGVTITSAGALRPHWVGEQMFFSTANGVELELEPCTQVVIMQALGYQGQEFTGGPIEMRGRLKYIDTCSDTVLIGPPTLGDPCFNHLHFPPGVVQTAHTHPSTRFGVVARGHGVCRCENISVELVSGRLFYIRRDAIHAFVTESGASMDVVAYHPDTDFGPTHQDHPMVNRTWVGGVKIDNRAGAHEIASIIEGRGGVAVPDAYLPVESAKRI